MQRVTDTKDREKQFPPLQLNTQRQKDTGTHLEDIQKVMEIKRGRKI